MTFVYLRRAAGVRFGASAVLIAFALAGCAELADEPAGTRSEGDLFADRIADATIDLEIGIADGDPRYVLGSVGGIAIDERGRIFVADGRNHAIRVYDAAGEFVQQFGRFGDGPGDLLNPCCLAFDAAGRLWVWNAADTRPRIRYDVFDVADGRPLHVLRVRSLDPEIGTLLGGRLVFHRDGGVIHATSVYEQSDDYVPGRVTVGPTGAPVASPELGRRWLRPVRVHLDTTGEVLRRVLVPYLPPDSLGRVETTATFNPGGVSGRVRQTTWVAVPGSATQLFAHSPRGGFVDAVNARYVIRWYDDDGAQVRLTRRALEGPPLTADERDDARDSYRSRQDAARNQGGSLPDVQIPDRHHPLLRLFFDDDGRLWVQRTPAAGEAHDLADIYEADGTYLRTVRWPRRVRLERGAVRGDVAWGILLDEFDVPRVVRMRIADWPG